MRIVVLAGGLSMERNVSLSSGNKICRAQNSRWVSEETTAGVHRPIRNT